MEQKKNQDILFETLWCPSLAHFFSPFRPTWPCMLSTEVYLRPSGANPSNTTHDGTSPSTGHCSQTGHSCGDSCGHGVCVCSHLKQARVCLLPDFCLDKAYMLLLSTRERKRERDGKSS